MARRSASAASPSDPTLACPRCGARYESSARFCEPCRLPLVIDAPEHALNDPLNPTHERIRKIKPQLAEGELVKVAYVRDQAEGELVQGLLLEEGVPSLLRRSRGFDVPDFLAAGPRDVLVPQTGAPTAREVLLEAGLISPLDAEAGSTRELPTTPLRLLAGLIGALALGVLVIWLLSLVVR